MDNRYAVYNVPHEPFQYEPGTLSTLVRQPRDRELFANIEKHIQAVNALIAQARIESPANSHSELDKQKCLNDLSRTTQQIKSL